VASRAPASPAVSGGCGRAGWCVADLRFFLGVCRGFFCSCFSPRGLRCLGRWRWPPPGWPGRAARRLRRGWRWRLPAGGLRRCLRCAAPGALVRVRRLGVGGLAAGWPRAGGLGLRALARFSGGGLRPGSPFGGVCRGFFSCWCSRPFRALFRLPVRRAVRLRALFLAALPLGARAARGFLLVGLRFGLRPAVVCAPRGAGGGAALRCLGLGGLGARALGALASVPLLGLVGAGGRRLARLRVGAPPLVRRRGLAGCVVSLIGFCGSRSLSVSWLPLVRRAVGGALASGRGVGVGCAAGADRLVRLAAGGRARVWSVSSGRWGSGRGAFAARSCALVRACAGSGPGAGFVGFVSSPCPAGLLPSPVPARCFSGLGSGSWASLALAAGLGLPVVVFWCGPGAPGAVLPLSWGVWSPVSSGPFAGGWLLSLRFRRGGAARRLPGLP
jgi:hypothetical protein